MYPSEGRSQYSGTPALVLALAFLMLSGAAAGTTVAPATDASLFERSDVVLRGIVLASGVSEGLDGSPYTGIEIRPVEIFKGGLAGNLMLHQAGGTLPDGRFFRLWGSPEYVPGAEVIVFAIARPEGGFQTAEMLLGKFDISRDEKGSLFAVAPLAAGEPEGVTVLHDLRGRQRRSNAPRHLDSVDAPREVESFTAWLRNGARGDQPLSPQPVGRLRPVMIEGFNRIAPDWVSLSSTLWRYNNNGTAAWYLNGTANITGGGTAEAQRALATWTNDPLSTINFTLGGSNPIHLNAMTSPCGWSTPLPPSMGVIGCGGPKGWGSHSWRGDAYQTITGGEVWLRAYSTLNQISSAVTESVILHELGHALGLGHSDEGSSPRDTCKGDEGSAIMRATVQSRTTLGTDDQDAIRWMYGDGGSSCAGAPAPCSSPSITLQPQSTSITTGASVTLSVAASGATSYQWYVGAAGNAASPISGATGSSILVTPPSTTSYWVRVTNSCGSANSATVTVTVNAPACSVPSITSQPQSRTITSGQATTISVSASGATGYQWYFGSSGNTSSPIPGATGSSLTVSPSVSTSYWARVTNSCGSVNSFAASVTVTAPACSSPTILSNPASVTIAAGTSATLSVSAAGATAFQWYIGTSGNTAAPVAGATGSSLAVSPGGSTSYWVRVANSCGYADSAAATVAVSAARTGGRKRPASASARPAAGILVPQP
jgi:hypothetical protein